MDPSIHEDFVSLLREEEFCDTSWVRKLDEFDEPPLFTRYTQLDFLWKVPSWDRCTETLRASLWCLEKVTKEAALDTLDRKYFISVTLADFDDWHRGEQPIPTPAILVNPKEEATPSSAVPFVQPHSEDGIAVDKWLASLGSRYTETFCVAELPPGTDEPELKRIYVGWRSDPTTNIASVGSHMANSFPAD